MGRSTRFVLKEGQRVRGQPAVAVHVEPPPARAEAAALRALVTEPGGPGDGPRRRAVRPVGQFDPLEPALGQFGVRHGGRRARHDRVPAPALMQPGGERAGAVRLVPHDGDQADERVRPALHHGDGVRPLRLDQSVDVGAGGGLVGDLCGIGHADGARVEGRQDGGRVRGAEEAELDGCGAGHAGSIAPTGAGK